MSSRDNHTGDGAINTEEHLGDGGQNRKAVGLFARDSYGTGVFELSALSTASGAVLSTTPASVSAQLTLGNVTLNPSPNHIGSVSIFGEVTANTGMTTLFPGPNQIGSVTISNTPNVQLAHLLSLASGQEIRSLATILNFPPLLSLASGQEIKSLSTILNWPTDLTSLASGTEVKALATILNWPTNLVSLASGTEVRSLATILNWPTSLTSLASGTEVRSLATLLNQPPLVASSAYIGLASVNIGGTLPALTAGSAYIGLASVNVGNVINSIATIAPRTDYIGLVSVSGNVAVSSLPALVASSAFIGIVTVANMPDVDPTNTFVDTKKGVLAFGTTRLSGASSLGKPLLIDDSGGLVVYERSLSTSIATVISGAASATIFVPPSGKRWYMHSLFMNTQGATEGTIKSGAKPVFPFVGLTTISGLTHTIPNPGFPAAAVDEAFVVTLNSAATVSIAATFHFE